MTVPAKKLTVAQRAKLARILREFKSRAPHSGKKAPTAVAVALQQAAQMQRPGQGGAPPWLVQRTQANDVFPRM